MHTMYKQREHRNHQNIYVNDHAHGMCLYAFNLIDILRHIERSCHSRVLYKYKQQTYVYVYSTIQ